MSFTVTILGNNSALPAFGRHPSAQVIQIGSRMFLVDCGEGTQMRLSDLKIKRSKIQHIFISHLHGDHVFGLPGLITSFNLNGRKDPLTIYGPAPIQKMMETIMECSQVHLNFEIIWVELDIKQQIVFQNNRLTISAFPLDHRIPTLGYLFAEQEAGDHFIREKLQEFEVTPEGIKTLLSGSSWTNANGIDIDMSMVAEGRFRQRSYAYCSDTRYFPDVIQMIEGVDLMYHESTFGDELEKEAIERFHSTARHAGKIAKQANVKKLLLGHYSSRYKFLDGLLSEARSEFSNTFLSQEGEAYAVDFQ